MKVSWIDGVPFIEHQTCPARIRLYDVVLTVAAAIHSEILVVIDEHYLVSCRSDGVRDLAVDGIDHVVESRSQLLCQVLLANSVLPERPSLIIATGCV